VWIVVSIIFFVVNIKRRLFLPIEVKELDVVVSTITEREGDFDFHIVVEVFEDICTVNELLAIAQRYAVAKMLREKKTYLDISEATGASTATISRVNRSLNFGNDGYDLTFSRLDNNDKK